jgi:hypothetical protein
MKMVSKKGAVLLGAALAVCALAAPSMASAASWGVIGTTHTLDSPNLGFVSHIGPPAGQLAWTCLESQIHVDVASAAALRVTGVTFKNCTTITALGGCTVTATPTGLPWTVTGATTSSIQIEGLFVDLAFETRPGGAPGSCPLDNQSATWTGALTGGAWDAAAHAITLIASPGSVLHSTFGTTNPAPSTVMGTLHDTTQSLTLS